MTEGLVSFNRRFAGRLYRDGNEYVFLYDDGYYVDPAAKAISFSFPKVKKEYRSNKLFGFFSGLLSYSVLVFCPVYNKQGKL